jgi:hypothetical protein
MSVRDIVIASRRVTVFFDHRTAPSTVADQRRIEQAIETLMAPAPHAVTDEAQETLPWRHNPRGAWGWFGRYEASDAPDAVRGRSRLPYADLGMAQPTGSSWR